MHNLTQKKLVPFTPCGHAIRDHPLRPSTGGWRLTVSLMLLGVYLFMFVGQTTAGPTDAWVHIDGKKSPEMIPQYSVWNAALRYIDGGPTRNGRKLIPLALQDVLTAEDTKALLAEAAAQVKRNKACEARVLELIPLKTPANREEIRRRNDDIDMECRWEVIHARDRLLETLSPAGRVALSTWVEAFKSGMSITIHRDNLAKFLLPQ